MAADEHGDQRDPSGEQDGGGSGELAILVFPATGGTRRGCLAASVVNPPQSNTTAPTDFGYACSLQRASFVECALFKENAVPFVIGHCIL